ncbi:CRISPR-associated protein Cas4 [Chitinophaga pendula]|uniref:CRISPR-associated protein Cas4 n=1 Tax=Chitinophaga TaxID=79328 RepID=UPI000BAE6EEA|nr:MULTISPECIES: CRISPR-associated protein Cas4 [Chitinophaga]ASZ11933.1 CRISPR-associated protein Cas4 [Chitinophaga sp. MD30]UCJ05038.1 CRISPR-associated protein Cas4 [Chitinophaga pendula]
MHINATLINLYHICARECWLHANGIRMEHTSDTVYDGKLLHEMSYPLRADRHTEISLTAEFSNEIVLTGKVDFYDSKARTIHETKRSNKTAAAHEWQCKFYIWLFALNGIDDVQAILEYPKSRERTNIFLSEADSVYLSNTVDEVYHLLRSDLCPPRLDEKICKHCSYHDLCYSGEDLSSY